MTVKRLGKIYERMLAEHWRTYEIFEIGEIKQNKKTCEIEKNESLQLLRA